MNSCVLIQFFHHDHASLGWHGRSPKGLPVGHIHQGTYIPQKVLPMSLYESVTYVYRLYLHFSYCYFLLVPKESNQRKGTPMNPPFRSVRSLEKSGSRRNSLRSNSRRFPPDFPALAHRVQGGFQKTLMNKICWSRL